ncbi:MAG: hypothetical protein ACOX3T_00700 [Bdellovibrionota bacterium]
MNISKPIGDSSYGPFIIRGVIGAYLFIVGLAPLDNIAGFADGIKNMYGFSENTSMMLGSNFPYICIFTGFFLIIGMWTTLTASLAAGIFAFLIYNFGITVTPETPMHQDIMMLAFRVSKHPITSYLFNRDVIAFAASISLLYTGAGFFSIDSFRKG